MSKLIINVYAVTESGSSAEKAAKTVRTVKNSVASLSAKIDPKIQNRKNIRKRFKNVLEDLSTAESKMVKIQNFVDSGAEKYQQVDLSIKSKKPIDFN